MSDNDATLQYAKSCFERAHSTGYPEDFSISPVWRVDQEAMVTAIRQFETVEQVNRYAMGGMFDFRYSGVRSVIEFKIREMERLFTSFTFLEHPDLRESPYSNEESLEEVDGLPYSNMFLYHLNFYLRSTSTFHSLGPIKRVIEIGSGYGGLARIFQIMNPGNSYTLIDLPESLFFAQIFLSLNFPDAKILYLDHDYQEGEGKIETEEFDFVLVPIQMSDRIVGQEFDIAINTSSFQEMADSTVDYWMNFIEHKVRVKGFYSCNYYLKLQYPETSGAESNLMCPVLDPFWKVKYFRINPEIVTVDANTRNWLELCVERIPSEEQKTGTLEEAASRLLEKGQRQPKGNNDWFESLWMAIWYFPSKESIHEMLDGIQLFKQGLGTKNLLWDQHFLFGPGDMSRTTSMWVLGLRRRFPRLWNVLRINKAFAKLCLRSMCDLIRGRRLDAPNEYREEVFYRKMLEDLE